MYYLLNTTCNLVNTVAVATRAERRPFNCFKRNAENKVTFVFLLKYSLNLSLMPIRKQNLSLVVYITIFQAHMYSGSNG